MKSNESDDKLVKQRLFESQKNGWNSLACVERRRHIRAKTQLTRNDREIRIILSPHGCFCFFFCCCCCGCRSHVDAQFISSFPVKQQRKQILHKNNGQLSVTHFTLKLYISPSLSPSVSVYFTFSRTILLIAQRRRRRRRSEIYFYFYLFIENANLTQHTTYKIGSAQNK